MTLSLAALLCATQPLAAEGAAARQVTVKPLAELVTHPKGSAPALAVSLNESRVSAELAAVVKRVAVRVGDRVEAGEPLVELACDDFRLRQSRSEAALKAAEARQEFASAQLARAESLRSGDNLAEELLQQRRSESAAAKADHAAAEADLRSARLDVARCSVTAPFAGVVLARQIAEGEWAAPGAAVVTLLDSRRLELSAQIGVEDAEAVRGAKELRFTANGESYPVTLRSLPGRVDPKLRQREARLLFGERTPLPGEAGRLEWRSATPHLPANFAVRRDDRLGVFVEEQGRARFVELPGAIEGRPLPAAPLADGARLVVEGRQTLRDGDAIKVVR